VRIYERNSPAFTKASEGGVKEVGKQVMARQLMQEALP